MHIQNMTSADLKELYRLQPEGWPDIVPEFESYIKRDFCYPIKTVINGKIIGTGVSIVFNKTAWLAHIIVASEYRNRGLGSIITEKLIEIARKNGVETCLLIATELGLPVYKKAGFRVLADYYFLERKQPGKIEIPTAGIEKYRNVYLNELLSLDKKITGENRESLIRLHLNDSWVFREDGKITGFYLPRLGEGPIMAETLNAGLELMKIRIADSGKAVLPAANYAGIEFLRKNGFCLTEKKGVRMLLGQDVDWKPECIYNRIGGNYG
ncbi:MAG: GNAT family N-acetyltransferase [Bacteroidota bacterium]